MKKLFLLIIALVLSFHVFSQNTERELIIKNETNKEYLGLYYSSYIPLQDMYITKEGQVNGDYKYKFFKVEPIDEFNKLFTKDLNIKIYITKDSTFYEILSFKLDCSKVTVELYDSYYQIIYKRYNGEMREQRQYLFKTY